MSKGKKEQELLVRLIEKAISEFAAVADELSIAASSVGRLHAGRRRELESVERRLRTVAQGLDEELMLSPHPRFTRLLLGAGKVGLTLALESGQVEVR